MKSVGSASELLTIRPNAQRYRFLSGRGDPVIPAGVTIIIGAGSLALGLSNALAITFQCLMPVMVVFLVWRWLYFRFARITVDDRTVTSVGWGLRSRSVPRSAIRCLVFSGLLVGWGDTVPMLLFVGQDGRAVLKVTAALYMEGDINHVALTLGVPISQRTLRTAKDLAIEVPGSMALWERHATALGITIGIALMILVIALLATLDH